MFFCPNCDNVFDITNINKEQGGGAKLDYQELVNRILLKETIESDIISQLSLDDLVKHDAYNNLKPTHREYVFNKVMELTKNIEKKLKDTDVKESQNRMYFICKNCGTTKRIKPNTLLFSKVSNDISQSYVASDLTIMKYSDILPITKKYICPNNNCESHTDLTKREAKFFRLNNSFRLKYLCMACDTIFDP
jgi:uncharacterized protein YlaI/transcription elongation factor Elf1